MNKKISLILFSTFIVQTMTACNSGTNGVSPKISSTLAKNELFESTLSNKQNLKSGNFYLFDQWYNYLDPIISNARYNVDKRYVNISELNKLALGSSGVIDMVNNSQYRLSDICVFQYGVQFLFTPVENRTMYHHPMQLINLDISQGYLSRIIDLNYLQSQGFTTCYKDTISEPTTLSVPSVNNSSNVTKQPLDIPLGEDNDDLKSEPDFPYFTNRNNEKKIYPAIVEDPQFYKQGVNNFKASTTGIGAVLYRPLGATHVGFVFDEPVDFNSIANKYKIKIEHHLIDPNRFISSVKSADIGVPTKPNADKPNEKLEVSLRLSTSDARMQHFANNNIINYNANDKYDSERLVLSLILANNAHTEKYFRQNGVVCYTFSRDTILIYNALSNGTPPDQIDLTMLKLANSQKIK